MESDMKETMEITQLVTRRGDRWTVNSNCSRIEEHSAAGEGDRWFYDVYFHGETRMIRVFDPIEVEFAGG